MITSEWDSFLQFSSPSFLASFCHHCFQCLSLDYHLSVASTYHRTKFRFHRVAIKALAFIPARLPAECHLTQHHMKQSRRINQLSLAQLVTHRVSIMKWLWIGAIKFGVVGYTEIDGHKIAYQFHILPPIFFFIIFSSTFDKLIGFINAEPCSVNRKKNWAKITENSDITLILPTISPILISCIRVVHFLELMSQHSHRIIN